MRFKERETERKKERETVCGKQVMFCVELDQGLKRRCKILKTNCDK